MKAILTLLLAIPTIAFSADAAPQNIRVGLVTVPPFVFPNKTIDDPDPGIAFELWKTIAQDNQWMSTYSSFSSMQDAADALAAGKIDVIVGPASITSDRVQSVDFSQPFFRSGLQIMVSQIRTDTFLGVLESFLTPAHLKVYGVLLLVMIVLCIWVTIFERKHNPDFPKTWRDGMAESFYYVVSLMFTGKSVYKGFSGVLGRLMLVVWMFAGIIVVAYITGSVASRMTASKLGEINKPGDLPGKTIGTVSGTPGLQYLKDRDIDFIEYKNLNDAVSDLVLKSPPIQAIVGDSPILQYYDNQHQKIPITEVGRVFNPDNYGFAFPKGSPLIEPVNHTLLKLIESGSMLELAQRYLGQVYQL